MRQIRSFTDDCYYRLISRVAHKALFLDDGEKDAFLELLWRVSPFS